MCLIHLLMIERPQTSFFEVSAGLFHSGDEYFFAKTIKRLSTNKKKKKMLTLLRKPCFGFPAGPQTLYRTEKTTISFVWEDQPSLVREMDQGQIFECTKLRIRALKETSTRINERRKEHEQAI